MFKALKRWWKYLTAKVSGNSCMNSVIFCRCRSGETASVLMLRPVRSG